MPLHLRTDRGDLRLTLSNGNDVLDTQLAATPQEANQAAIMMIASRDAFDVGDTLTCRHEEDGQDATVVRGLPRPRRGAAMTKITVDLPPDEAMALAQMVKRLGYDDAERLSSRYDGGHERDLMLAGINKLQRALAEAGFAPR
jgi:hypothetical protein